MLQNPISNDIQKFQILETFSKFYIIGSDYAETKYSILKIDRMVYELNIQEEKVYYNKKEVGELINMLQVGNDLKINQKLPSRQLKILNAFAILGFIKFLFGYYLVVVTKKGKIGSIGRRNLYSIESTQIIYLPNNMQAFSNNDEQRFLKMFQNIYFANNFYFSYSYDLTNTMQINMLKMSLPHHSTNNSIDKYHKFRPNWEFVWNRHLITPHLKKVKLFWFTPVIHGYLKQSYISMHGQNLALTLIARRSSFFAGTRYLKRGLSQLGGFTANCVETEQILQDLSVQYTFSAYVQMRGSIPIFWTQEISKMVPKPPIHITNNDPFCLAIGKHFKRLLERYGAPIVVLNLAKDRETKKGEALLTTDYIENIDFLNQFLSEPHKIVYHALDLAKLNKNKTTDVIKELEEICNNLIVKTSLMKCTDIAIDYYQTGVIRTNCIDCLDRTNTAQFVIGKCALEKQLLSFKLLDTQNIPLSYECDAVRLLEDLYEEQGDVLALQYGGSQLVHRVDTYRKASPSWTYQSRDMMQTFSRYYSNTFSDAEKQDSINILLGVYVPSLHYPPGCWDIPSDTILQNLAFAEYFKYQNDHCKNANTMMDCDQISCMIKLLCQNRPICKWYELETLKSLPYPTVVLPADDKNNEENELVVGQSYYNNPALDEYFNYYKPYEYFSFHNLFSINAINTERDYTPPNASINSPFCSHKQEFKQDKDESFESLQTTLHLTPSNDAMKEFYVNNDEMETYMQYMNASIMTLDINFGQGDFKYKSWDVDDDEILTKNTDKLVILNININESDMLKYQNNCNCLTESTVYEYYAKYLDSLAM